jgi:hypothetical protein
MNANRSQKTKNEPQTDQQIRTIDRRDDQIGPGNTRGWIEKEFQNCSTSPRSVGGGKKRLGLAARISGFSGPGSLALAPFSASMISGMFCAAAWPALKVSPASTAEAAVMNFRRPNSSPTSLGPELGVSSLSLRCFMECDLAGGVIPGQQTRCFRPARRSYQVSVDADNHRNRQRGKDSPGRASAARSSGSCRSGFDGFGATRLCRLRTRLSIRRLFMRKH